MATFGLLGLFHGLRDVHDSSLKQYSTDFGILDEQYVPWLSQHPVRKITNGRHIDDQYHYLRHLGQGFEGSAALYMDATSGDRVVIKSFTNVARNKIPELLVMSDLGNSTTTWPTEIEAGLLLGETPVKASYVPVLDYFILQSETNWSWALVMPFASKGNLMNLATNERRREDRDADQLDQAYRQAFNDMLTALASLHGADLCHDDIKPDNILVESNDHWLVGDLGGIRHTSHPWHATTTWQLQNQWPNCQFNDIRRSLKTYLWFLREASGDKVSFDRQFWEKSTAWSKMYWTYVENPVDIQEVLEASRWEFAERTAAREDADLAADRSMLRESNSELNRATEAELTCTTVPKRLWKHWWWWLYQS